MVFGSEDKKDGIRLNRREVFDHREWIVSVNSAFRTLHDRLHPPWRTLQDSGLVLRACHKMFGINYLSTARRVENTILVCQDEPRVPTWPYLCVLQANVAPQPSWHRCWSSGAAQKSNISRVGKRCCNPRPSGALRAALNKKAPTSFGFRTAQWPKILKDHLRLFWLWGSSFSAVSP